jgi:hypothetical protein
MNSYKLIKNNINSRLLLKLSQIGYALNCDILFTNRNPEIEQNINLVKNLKYGDNIFISVLPGELTINLNKLVNILKENKIKVNFYLMYEPVIPIEILSLLLPVSINMFINNNIYEHPQIHCMPIGIRDCEEVVPNHKGFSHQYIYIEGFKTVEKNILCLMCFSFTHFERNRCYDLLKNKDFVVNLNDNTYEKQPSIHCGKVPVWINYEYTHRSTYVLSPRGAGEDCHRFYEAIYLDSIPIVKRTNTPFDKLYKIFPCLIVNDWNEVTRDLLESKKEESTQKLIKFKSNYPNAFTDLDSIKELLLQT